jgi:LysM repeat protein
MRVQRFHRFALLLLIFSLSIMIGQAQEQNLLTNPGFENGFRNVTGRSNPQVANGWEAWVSSNEDAPGFQQPPFYIPATAANTAGLIPRVRTGTNAQVYYSFYETHDAGIYQRVTGITAGTELRFSIYGYVFSNNLNELDLSEDDGGVVLRVGIDPAGGTDPFGSNVIYSEALITYDTFREYSIIATAESNAVTVFVRSTISEPVQNTVIYLDDAVLNVTPESQPASTATNTARPTNTAVPTSTATNTSAPVINTVAATNTSAPTNTTAPVNTVAPTNTVTSGEATPTREGPAVATNTTAPTNTQAGVPTATTGAVATASSTRAAATAVAGFPGTIIHTVRRGDTVGGIAVRYGSSIEAIIEANALNEDAFILVGQGLVVPIRVVPATETPSPTPLVTATSTQTTSGGGTSGDVYVVQRGDTLTAIAIRFNTTVANLVQLNGITNPNTIFIGQRLLLPGGTAPIPPTATAAPAATATTSGGVIPTPTSTSPSSGQTYIVQPNDTLYRLAIRFNVSIVTLANINGITNYNYIQIGQVLRIP